MTHDHDDELDGLFSHARNDGPGPDLMVRVLADAAAVQADATATAAVAPVPARAGLLAALLQGLGGWTAVSGITAAGVMGLAVGLYAPATVTGLLDGDSLSLGYGTLEFTPDVGDLWTEDGDV